MKKIILLTLITLNAFGLTLDTQPHLTIPAQLDKEIVLVDGETSEVSATVLSDVYMDDKIVIPRGAKLKGTVENFDKATGISSFKFNKVLVGNNSFKRTLTVNSADLSLGLKGEVRDLDGKLFLGTFITGYNSEAQRVIKNNCKNLEKDLLNKKAVTYKSGEELKNTLGLNNQKDKRVYYVPKNVELIAVENIKPLF